MASVVENEGDNKFPNPKIGKTQFLTSVRDFAPDGILLGVERVSKVFPSSQEPTKAQIMLEMTILSDMEKCRVFDMDDDGEYITKMDELTGREERVIKLEPISKDDLVSFPIFLPCGKPKKISNDADLTFYPTSSAYPLFKLALMEAGELPENMGNKAFATTQEELKEALEGFSFIGKCEEIKGKYNYMRLLAEPEG
jgi:hypothetical protein